MLANNVQESSTTVGTGSFTLAGSSQNGRTFSSQYPINKRLNYTIDDGAGNFETGVGYLSNSTTLVRELPQDGSSTLPVNFGAGTKQVFVARSAQHSNIPPNLSFLGSSNKILIPPHVIGTTNTYTKLASRLFLIPWKNDFTGDVNNWVVSIITASAGTNMRIGIYDVDPSTGNPTGSPLYESDNIPCDNTGLVESAMANNTVNPSTTIKLPDYFFLGMAFEDATVGVKAANYTDSNKTWLALSNSYAQGIIWQSFTMGAPSAGVPVLPTIGTISSDFSNYPIAGFN